MKITSGDITSKIQKTPLDPKTLRATFDQLRKTADAVMSDHHDKLYTLLSQCYGIYYQISLAGDNQEKLENEIDKLYNLEITVDREESKTLHTKIVRLVFENNQPDRKQVSRYASVLRNAFESDTARDLYTDSMARIAPEHFRDWISVKGIYKAAQATKKSKVSEYDVETALMDLMFMQSLAQVKSSAVGSQIQKGHDQYKLAICRWDDASKSLELYKIIVDEDKVKTVFKPYVKEVSEKMKEMTKTFMENMREAKKQELIKRVVEEARG